MPRIDEAGGNSARLAHELQRGLGIDAEDRNRDGNETR